MDSSGNIEHVDFGGNPLHRQEGGYDNIGDIIVIHSNIVNEEGVETLTSLLSHEGAHKQQHVEQSGREYSREMETEAFIFQQAVDADLGPDSALQTRKETERMVDIKYDHVPVGKDHKSLSDFDEVEDLSRKIYKERLPNRYENHPERIGLEGDQTVWRYPDGSTRLGGSGAPPPTTAPIFEKGKPQKPPATWDD